MTISADSNEMFIAIMEDIVDRATGLKTAISLPTDEDSVNKRLKDTEFGIFGNLPYEAVFFRCLDTLVCLSLELFGTCVHTTSTSDLRV